MRLRSAQRRVQLSSKHIQLNERNRTASWRCLPFTQLANTLARRSKRRPGRPLRGNTGGKTRIGIDWIRVVTLPGTPNETDVGAAQRARAWLEERFGPRDHGGRGKDLYKFGEYWENGVQLLWKHKSAGPSIIVPGSVLSELDWEQQLHFLQDILIGRRCTRLDIAVDFIEHDVALIDEIRRGCLEPLRRGQTDSSGKPLSELVGATRVTPQEEWNAGACVRYGVNLGRRGSDGSGRYVRCYDKGLESGEEPIGKWERFEAEFSKGCAQDVALAILLAGRPDEALREAFELACSAVDFREVRVRTRGKSVGQMVYAKERPRAAWWEKIRGVGVRARPVRERKKPTLDGVSENARNAVRPLLALATALRVDPKKLVVQMLGGCPKTPPLASTRSLVEQFQGRNAKVGGALIPPLLPSS